MDTPGQIELQNKSYESLRHEKAGILEEKAILTSKQKQIQNINLNENSEQRIGLLSQMKKNIEEPNLTFLIKKCISLKLIVILGLLAFSLFLYIITLRGCSSEVEMICVAEMVPLIPKFCLYMFMVTLIIDGVFYGIIKKVIPKTYASCILMEVSLIMAISNGQSFQNHGSYNRLFFIACLILNLFTMMLLNWIVKKFRKYPKITATFLLFIGVLLYFLIGVEWFGKSCDTWNNGLKNSVLLKNNDCKIPQPEICFHELTNNWFDLSRLLNKNDCSLVKDNIDIYKGDADFVAYPKTQYFLREEKNFEVYQQNIISQTKSVKESDIEYEKLEVVLDQRDKDNRKILINVHRNESLIEERTKIFNQTENKPLVKNILMIFIDSVSRQHFPRKLKKTYQWIENFYENKTSNLESFQFFKYHTSGSHTTPNMMRIFYGTEYETAYESYPLTKTFKKQGYITGKSNNFCGSTYFDISSTEEELNYLDMESFDHENTALFCDPNYQKLDEGGAYGYLEGSFAMVRRCLYGRDTHNYVIDYGKKFWETYKKQPKVLEIGFMDGHEPSAELLQYLDDPIHNFLVELENNKLLDDTAIFQAVFHDYSL